MGPVLYVIIYMYMLMCCRVPVCETLGVNLHAGRDFQITDWNRCPTSKQTGFLTLHNKPLGECVFGCGIRIQCEAVVYRKKHRSCELLLSKIDSPGIRRHAPCLYVELDNVSKNAISNICNAPCSNDSGCNNNARDVCAVTDCQFPSVPNGKVVGNMITAGSILMLECDDSYEAVGSNVYMTCSPSTLQWLPILNCTEARDVTDCSDVLARGYGSNSGGYNITLPISGTPKYVYCDMDTDGGGWTVFQNRFNGVVDFFRPFADYVSGFGDIDGEFWMGLDSIHDMTSGVTSDLQIQLLAVNGLIATFTYDRFYLSEGPKYTLHFKQTASNYDDTIVQWVSSVTAVSSEYFTERWSAEQIIGKPDVYPQYGDIPEAWSPLNKTKGQYIVLRFATKVIVTGVDIYETFHGGGVTDISAYIRNPITNSLYWHALYTGTKRDITNSRIFSPSLNKIDQETNTIRLDVDSLGNWVELDAVCLRGRAAGLKENNGSNFSTFDNDVDASNGDCASTYHGGWWYTGCTHTNLNGRYGSPGTTATQNGIIFKPFRGSESLAATRMMFRRNSNQ